MNSFIFDVEPAIGPKGERRFAYGGGRMFHLEFPGASCSLPRVIFGPKRMPPAASVSWRHPAGRACPHAAVFLSHDAPLLFSLFHRPFITHFVCLFTILYVV
jgi:hypothetical protein